MSQVYYRNRQGAYEYDTYILAYAAHPLPWAVLLVAVVAWRLNVTLAAAATAHGKGSPVYTVWLQPHLAASSWPFRRLAAFSLYAAVLAAQGVAAAWVLTTWWRWAVKMAARWPLWANSTLASQGAYTFAAVGMLLIGLALAEWTGLMVVVQMRCLWELVSGGGTTLSRAAMVAPGKEKGNKDGRVRTLSIS